MSYITVLQQERLRYWILKYLEPFAGQEEEAPAPEPALGVAKPAGVAGGQPEGVEAVTDATADVTPAEAEAFAKAVISEPEDGEPISEPEVSAPPRPAQPGPAPVSPPATAPASSPAPIPICPEQQYQTPSKPTST